MADQLLNNLVVLKKRNATTTSLIVAEKFGKNHRDVLRAIRNLECSKDFTERNFAPVKYKDSTGRSLPMYQITRDGFSFLAMGFTGKEAALWKERFINAFNAMETALLSQSNLDWQQQRNDGKQVRRELTDVVSEFVEYATAQGSKSAKMYYLQISKMTNKALFMIGRKAPENFRNMLDGMQLAFLQTAEFVARNEIRKGMEEGLFYKGIYAAARDKVVEFGAMVGKTPVLETKIPKPVQQTINF